MSRKAWCSLVLAIAAEVVLLWAVIAIWPR